MSNPIIRNDNTDSVNDKSRQAEFVNSHNRIKELLGDREGKWLAAESGVAPSSISDYINGRMPRVDAAIRIAEALDVDVSYVFGTQPLPRINAAHVKRQVKHSAEPSVLLPEIDISYSMGGGLAISDYADAKTVSFPREWLRQLIRGNFNQVFIARGEGDSMQPTLLDDDIVIVDTAQNALTSQDRIWCFSYGELGMIKRLRAQPDGGIEILSDNPAIRPFNAYDGEVHILGRVIWVGRRT